MQQQQQHRRVSYTPETERRLRDALAVLPLASARHITVSVPLFGAVPVGQVLEDLGFQDIVESLAFVPGGITRLLGVPERVTRIDCDHNHLESIAELGAGLQTLNAAHNRMRGSVDVSHLATMQYLDLSDNAISRFARSDHLGAAAMQQEDEAYDDDDDDGGFAPSLVTINVSRNHLVGRLDLRSCTGLRLLDARFNPPHLKICVAGNPAVLLPAGAEPILTLATSNSTTAFVPTNAIKLTLIGGGSSSTGISSTGSSSTGSSSTGSSSTGSSSSSSGSSSTDDGSSVESSSMLQQPLMPMRLPQNFRAQVRAYFEAKQEYERSLAKMRVEGGGEAKCTQCGRTGGGMLFSGRNQVYTARCLARPHPCGFRMNIDRGRFVPLRAHATALRARLVAARESMIRLQYDALLGHLRADAVAEQFPNQVRRYNALLAQFREFERRADDQFFNVRQRHAAAAIRAQIAELAAEVSGLVADGKWAQAAQTQSREIRPLSDQLSAAVCPNRGAIVADDPDIGRSVVVLPDVAQHDPDVLTREYNIGALM